MPKLIVPSSFLCDCGYQCDFCETTVKEMVALSLKRNREQELVADDDQHGVIFSKGQWVELRCPIHGLLDVPKNMRRL